MSKPAYQQEPWFSMLLDAVAAGSQRSVAQQLAVSDATVNQVLRGTGLYGTGKASTVRIGQRVEDTYGKWECPFLSDGDEPKVIKSGECRAFAHRAPPTTSPRDLAHWRACQQCPMKSRSAPPVQRPVIPRPRHQSAVAPEGESNA